WLGGAFQVFKYCFTCKTEREFTSQRSDGAFTKVGCTVCGMFAWVDSGELKERIEKQYLYMMTKRSVY
ncbi:hypothetical protein, partial [Pseudomonas sp. 2995-1]|uniref:hypothetical protein n=1 Tax=Pseudomonas sp. 2995-1 TaxID=1712679 RepID=UPI001C4637E7